jgi:hypothetical protein
MAGKTSEELAREFNIKGSKSRCLHAALQPTIYPVITDVNKTIKEMAASQDISRNKICKYRSSLIKAGLEYPRSMEAERILCAIDGDPDTYRKIAEKTGKTLDQIGSFMKELRYKGKAKSIHMQRLGLASQYYEDMLQESIAWKTGDDVLLGIKLASRLPRRIEIKTKRGISNVFGRMLKGPAPLALKVIRDYMYEMGKHNHG